MAHLWRSLVVCLIATAALLAARVTVVRSQSSGPGCTISTSMDDSFFEDLIQSALTSGDGGGNVAVNLLQRPVRFVCLASAATEGRYHYASFVAFVEITANNNPPSEETVQLEILCVGQAATWSVASPLGVITSSDLSIERKIPATDPVQTAPLNKSCSACVEPGNANLGIFGLNPDDLFHCAGINIVSMQIFYSIVLSLSPSHFLSLPKIILNAACPSECKGLHQCVLDHDNVGQMECCNYYDREGNCVVECPNGEVPNDQFVCEGKRLHHAMPTLF